MVSFLCHGLRKALNVLEVDGYLVLIWGAFVGHPVLFFLRTLLEPLFDTTIVKIMPDSCKSFETVILFSRFSWLESDGDTEGPTLEYQTLISFLEAVQREVGIDDVLLWTLTDDRMQKEYDSNRDEWSDALHRIGKKMSDIYKTILAQMKKGSAVGSRRSSF